MSTEDTPNTLFGTDVNKKAKYYLTNADLLPAVLEAKEQGRLTNKLARMLMLLTDRYSRKANFNGYSFREDMVSVALVNLCQNALKFNPEKSSNPFAFYTTAIKNSFLQYIIDEQYQRDVRDSLLVENGREASYSYMEKHKSSDDIAYVIPTEAEVQAAAETKVPTSATPSPNRKKIADAKKKSKRQEMKEKKEQQVNKMLTF